MFEQLKEHAERLLGSEVLSPEDAAKLRAALDESQHTKDRSRDLERSGDQGEALRLARKASYKLRGAITSVTAVAAAELSPACRTLFM